jgi:hypothetical protein
MYLPLVSGKSMHEAKKRFREVNVIKTSFYMLNIHVVIGFSNGNESELCSMARYTNNKLLFYPDPPSVSERMAMKNMKVCF